MVYKCLKKMAQPFGNHTEAHWPVFFGICLIQTKMWSEMYKYFLKITPGLSSVNKGMKWHWLDTTNHSQNDCHHTTLLDFHKHQKTLKIYFHLSSMFTVIESKTHRSCIVGIYPTLAETCKKISSVISKKKVIYFRCFDLPCAIALLSQTVWSDWILYWSKEKCICILEHWK